MCVYGGGGGCEGGGVYLHSNQEKRVKYQSLISMQRKVM